MYLKLNLFTLISVENYLVLFIIEFLPQCLALDFSENKLDEHNNSINLTCKYTCESAKYILC